MVVVLLLLLSRIGIKSVRTAKKLVSNTPAFTQSAQERSEHTNRKSAQYNAHQQKRVLEALEDCLGETVFAGVPEQRGHRSQNQKLQQPQRNKIRETIDPLSNELQQSP
uniref:Putative secreted protein n=1 Tax=Panstrongylus lignarius TaxID=156445 RepID=A0A224XQA2_9HEMI